MGKNRRGGKKKVKPTASRTAEQPEQTINVDLCFVPANHEVSEKIAAVSGSSGRLVVVRAKEEKERDWPGRVFEDEDLSYEEAMLKFVAASQAKEEGPELPKEEQKGATEEMSAKESRQLLKKEEKQLQNERPQVREQRKMEDMACKEVRKKRKEEADRSLNKRERREQGQVKQAQDEQWHTNHWS